MRVVSWGVGCLLLSAGLCLPLGAQTANAKNWPTYTADVAPVLKANCLSCHTGKDSSAGLDLTKPEVVKAKVALLIQRMRGEGGKPVMPLGFKAVPKEQIAKIEQWAKYGAPLGGPKKTHWAYVAPVKPKALPFTGWGSNPIDGFVLERLKAAGFTPSKPASKETLLRRVYLDLIGIPPTVEQMDAFLSDKRPDAYERVVDQLLKNPHYGERQARFWLDLARYADSNGYEKDLTRVAFPYRDWVIKAFNQNLPFDQFTVEQLAGDLLPNSGLDQKIATGFHRNSMFNEEGGVDPAESQFLTVIDRISTTSTVWMGTTLGCARCHDHKFDPISQKDFYKTYAVFSNTDYRREGDYKKSFSEVWREPTVKVLTPEVQNRIAELKQKVSAKEQVLGTAFASKSQEFEDWKSALANHGAPTALMPTAAKGLAGTTLTIHGDGTVEPTGANPARDVYEVDIPSTGAGAIGLRLDVFPYNGKASGRSGSSNFVLTGIDVLVNGVRQELSQVRTDYTQVNHDAMSLIRPGGTPGWAVYPKGNEPHALIVTLAKPLAEGKLSVRLRCESPYDNHNLGAFRLSLVLGKYPFISLTPPSARTSDEAAKREFMTSLPEWQSLQSTRNELSSFEASIPSALVISEKPGAGELVAPVHHRGEFTSPGEVVNAGVPGVFPQPSEKVNRLTYAKWLVSAKNPLTARVQVNRIWAQYFGKGIVQTDEDFGTQGSLPTHPKLLDWLATEFMDRKWDMKAIHKLIVMSSTYRQSSATTQKLLERDPENVLLSRGPRLRMDAEMIRDNALAASGILNPKIGGPSVMPYQPDGVWGMVYSSENWMMARDAERNRRGIYVFVKRTSPYPSFMAFDATPREVCTTRRSRTNTPLQALTLLNDKAYLEPASALGVRMAAKGVVYGFRAATGRKPTSAELNILNRALSNFKQRYANKPELAKDLGGTPTTAAYTMLGNVILNLDETITKE